MRLLIKYEDFVEALNECGFLMFASGQLLSMGDMTRPEAWHTTPEDEDPWGWKDRLALSREGVYARAIGGLNSFISLKWHPRFIAAFTPPRALARRYQEGTVPPMAMKMGELFDSRLTWARHELSDALGVKRPQKGKFVGALTLLQREMAIVVSGSSQRTSDMGAPIGWPSMEYTRTDAYFPEAVAAAREQNRADSRQIIVDQALKLSPGLSGKDIARLFPDWT